MRANLAMLYCVCNGGIINCRVWTFFIPFIFDEDGEFGDDIFIWLFGYLPKPSFLFQWTAAATFASKVVVVALAKRGTAPTASATTLLSIPGITIAGVTITPEGRCTVTTATLIRRVPVGELLPLPVVGVGRQRRCDSGTVGGGGRHSPTLQIDDDSVG